MDSKILNVYIGRFDPIHLGHCKIINTIKNIDDSDSLILIGSVNSHLTNRDMMFLYSERKSFLKAIFPDINIIPICDMENPRWFVCLVKDLVEGFSHGKIYSKVIYYGGCEDDIKYLKTARLNTCVIDRKDDNISATQVRQALNDNDFNKVKVMTHEKVSSKIIKKFKEIEEEE